MTSKLSRKLVVAINRKLHQSNKQKLFNAAKRAKK
jgi:hypothetical protein